jgi:hypothetical protein
LYLDEDTSDRRLVAELRSRGAAQGRVLVTANASDFMAIHSRWMAAGQTHAGLLIAPRHRFPIGDFVRRILRMTSDRLETDNNVFFMSGS